MKTLITLLILSPLFLMAQRKDEPLTIGATAGFMTATRSAVVGELFIRYEVNKKWAVYPATFKINHRISNPSMPPVIEPRIGYKKGFIEFYGGMGWHGYNPDHRKDIDPYVGFKPGYGLMFYRKEKIFLTTGMAGKMFTIQLRIF